MYKMPFPLLFICICSPLLPPSIPFTCHTFILDFFPSSSSSSSSSSSCSLYVPLSSFHLDLFLIPLSVSSHHTLTPCMEFICSPLSFLFYPLTVFQFSSFFLHLPPPSNPCRGAVGRGGWTGGKGWRCNNP